MLGALPTELHRAFAEVARLGGARAVAEKKLRKNLQVEEPRDFYSLFYEVKKKKQKVRSAPAGGA